MIFLISKKEKTMENKEKINNKTLFVINLDDLTDHTLASLLKSNLKDVYFLFFSSYSIINLKNRLQEIDKNPLNNDNVFFSVYNGCILLNANLDHLTSFYYTTSLIFNDFVNQLNQVRLNLDTNNSILLNNDTKNITDENFKSLFNVISIETHQKIQNDKKYLVLKSTSKPPFSYIYYLNNLKNNISYLQEKNNILNNDVYVVYSKRCLVLYKNDDLKEFKILNDTKYDLDIKNVINLKYEINKDGVLKYLQSSIKNEEKISTNFSDTQTFYFDNNDAYTFIPSNASFSSLIIAYNKNHFLYDTTFNKDDFNDYYYFDVYYVKRINHKSKELIKIIDYLKNLNLNVIEK